MSLSLPGTPGGALRAIWRGLEDDEKAALLPHLLGGTSAEWIADLLTSVGLPISATTIRTYRRSLRNERTD